MKLYYSPLACSLADHIALREAGAAFDSERVDLRTRRTASGGDLADVTAKSYVPVLILDDGRILTENIAILDWIAGSFPSLAAPGEFGRTRTLEALAFISTEVHRQFKPMWHAGSEDDKAKARRTIPDLFDMLARAQVGDFLFGEEPGVADFYLFVMVLWAERFGVDVPLRLAALSARLRERPAVRSAMQIEGLI
jgi:glutathione S-transferase